MSYKCKICGADAPKFLEKKALEKYKAVYHRCENCGFLQVFDHPWLAESYSNAITSLDIGLVNRNLVFAPKVMILIDHFLKSSTNHYLDYGGGYGLFVRLMRDKGYDFLRYDKYCENLFAASFDYDIEEKERINFDLITAFEVFEHLSDPLAELDTLLQYTKNVFFSTELQPKNVDQLTDWWYLSPEIGQHISFYSQSSLEWLAKSRGLNFYTDGRYFHLFTEQKLSPVLFKLMTKNKVASSLSFLKRHKRSLLAADYKMLKSRLHNESNWEV